MILIRLRLLQLLSKIGGILNTLTQTKSDFDKLIVEVVDDVIKCCLGASNASIIYHYLEKKQYSLSDIPMKPEKFSEELRNILGFGSKQILCAPSIIEEEILEILQKRMGIRHSIQKPPDFPKQIKKLRQTYRQTITRNKQNYLSCYYNIITSNIMERTADTALLHLEIPDKLIARLQFFKVSLFQVKFES